MCVRVCVRARNQVVSEQANQKKVIKYCENGKDHGNGRDNNNDLGYKSKNKKENYNQKEIENDNKNVLMLQTFCFVNF